MSSNRLIYDKCAYGAELTENKNILNYTLSTDPFAREDKGQCRMQFGTMGNAVSKYTSAPLIQQESHLFGLTVHKTKCPGKLYQKSDYDNKKLVDRRDYTCPERLMNYDLNSKWDLGACQIFKIDSTYYHPPLNSASCKGAPIN